MGTAELEARDLSVDYSGSGVSLPALRNVDLVVARGSFVTVLGPSGSGKTTLLNAFAGLIQPTGGEALFRGKTIGGPGAERAVVFQRHALMPWLDVAENVAFPLKLKRIPKRQRLELVKPILAQVNLSDFATYPVWTLSGGMQQRVGLARALAADPAVLLFDEPLGALDAITREELQLVLLDLWATSGKTALLITHDIEEAILLGTELIVLSDRPGRIVERVQPPFARRIAAGEDARHLRSDAEFSALKERLRTVLAASKPLAAAPTGALA